MLKLGIFRCASESNRPGRGVSKRRKELRASQVHLPSLSSGEIASFIERSFNYSCRCVCERLHTTCQYLP